MTQGAYWYEFFIYYCPVCGRENSYKYRVHDRPRPTEYQERHHMKESYDWCDAL